VNCPKLLRLGDTQSAYVFSTIDRIVIVRIVAVDVVVIGIVAVGIIAVEVREALR
jgi:hypothetical protein